MPTPDDPVIRAFRLNLEQQKKRAKDLLRAARAGDPAALARLRAGRSQARKAASDGDGLSLADAQWAVARELGLASWPRLKAHIAAMEREQAATGALDGSVRTLHIRCGSDIAGRLTMAGFVGDFLEYSNPFCLGPVTGDPGEPGQIAARSHFLANNHSGMTLYSLPQLVEKLRREEEGLAAAARRYERVVLWFEHDSYDQLILARCLALFSGQAPQTLELISVNHFPGAMRFIGLGQLPAEALRLLWRSRTAVSAPQLAFGKAAWQAVTSPDPTGLVAILRMPDPALPDLRTALHRHLRELPSVRNGLGLTEQLFLDCLAEESQPLGRVFHRLMTERDPLPWLSDLILAHMAGAMLRAGEPPFTVDAAGDGPWYRRPLTLTGTGRRLLDGDRDWMDCAPPERWVGGLAIRPGAPVWRWDEAKREAVIR